MGAGGETLFVATRRMFLAACKDVAGYRIATAFQKFYTRRIEQSLGDVVIHKRLVFLF